MTITETNIEGCFEITPRVFTDERGYFFESFNLYTFEEHTGMRIDFVQDNQSFSKRGVLRGLHFQKGIYAQAKLVSVLAGEVLDVAVDLRKESPTFGNVVSLVLSDTNKKQLFIPRGCAHGFAVLSNTASFFYKCDNYYHKPSESGIMYNDETLNINWQIPHSELIISEKDMVLPSFKDYMAIGNPIE